MRALTEVNPNATQAYRTLAIEQVFVDLLSDAESRKSFLNDRGSYLEGFQLSPSDLDRLTNLPAEQVLAAVREVLGVSNSSNPFQPKDYDCTFGCLFLDPPAIRR